MSPWYHNHRLQNIMTRQYLYLLCRHKTSYCQCHFRDSLLLKKWHERHDRVSFCGPILRRLHVYTETGHWGLLYQHDLTTISIRDGYSPTFLHGLRLPTSVRLDYRPRLRDLFNLYEGQFFRRNEWCPSLLTALKRQGPFLHKTFIRHPLFSLYFFGYSHFLRVE